MLASGERGRGPQLRIYQSDDLLNWKMISTILAVPAESKISPTSKLKFGMNFECASFFSFAEMQYIVFGIEEDHNGNHHNSRYLLWMSGRLVLQDGKPRFQIKSHGMLDHGILYAAHIFRDSEGRTIQLGWADEDFKQHIMKEQGWAGCLALPRELYKISRPIVKGAKDQDAWNVDHSSGTMTTLGIRPAPQTSALREHIIPSTTLNSFGCLQSMNFSLQASFKNLSGSEKFTFNVRQCPHASEVTKVIFDIAAGLITVDRSRSSLESLGSTSPDSGSFHLLPNEDLQVQVFLDNSIIEIYANGRFALTSRVYPTLETSIRASYDFGDFVERNVDFRCWEGLRDAWPRRMVVENDLVGINSPLQMIDEKRVVISEESVEVEVASHSITSH